MGLIDSLLPEFDHEMTTTRKVLERVPEDRFDWKPHAKSFSMGQLAQHVATIPMWGAVTLNQSELDLAGDHGWSRSRRAPSCCRCSTSTCPARVTRSAATADAALMAPWSLKRGTQTIFTMPRVGVWRSFVMSHLIHHRAQLAVYLRLNDIPVPSMYGPSADEGAF
jgi:uncharacterized damage-inducible protein DinB